MGAPRCVGTSSPTVHRRADRPLDPARRGPLTGVRVADFCWMGVGSVATRLLADFGAQVIKIEDRIRIDTPRRLPIYKDEPARNFGEEVIDADPNKGGLFNNYSRNKLGVTINLRTPAGRDLAERLIAAQRRRLGELRARRDGAVGPHLRAPPRAVAARDLRPHERLRPQRPARRVPQLRPGGAGRQRAVLHQRAARPRAVGLGPVVHGQPGGVLQLGGAADGHLPAQRDRRGHRDRRVGDRGRHQPRRAGPARRQRQRPLGRAARTTRPATAWSGPTPRRTACTRRAATTAGWRSPCSTTPSGPASSGPSATPTGPATSGSPRRTPATPTRTSSTSTSPSGRAAATATRSPSCCRPPACRPGAVQNAEDLNETDPQIAHRGVFFEMDHPVIGRARFEGNPFTFSRDHVRTTGARRRCSARTTRTCSRTSSASTTTSTSG